MFQVNVTIGFNPETLAALSSLFAGVPKAAEPLKGEITAEDLRQLAPKTQRPSTANGKALKVAEPVKEPVINGEATEEQEEGGEGGTATTEITMEQVRAAVVVKKQALNSDVEIRKIAIEFDAVDEKGKTKLALLKPENYAEFLTRVEALK